VVHYTFFLGMVHYTYQSVTFSLCGFIQRRKNFMNNKYRLGLGEINQVSSSTIVQVAHFRYSDKNENNLQVAPSKKTCKLQQQLSIFLSFLFGSVYIFFGSEGVFSCLTIHSEWICLGPMLESSKALFVSLEGKTWKKKNRQVEKIRENRMGGLCGLTFLHNTEPSSFGGN